MDHETKEYIKSIHINCIEREDDLKIENEQLKTQNNELRVKMNENGAVALQLKSDKVKLKEIVFFLFEEAKSGYAIIDEEYYKKQIESI